MTSPDAADAEVGDDAGGEDDRFRRHLRASLVTFPLVLFAVAVLGYTVYLGANIALVLMLAPGLIAFAFIIYLKTFLLDLSEGPAYPEEYGGDDAPESVFWGGSGEGRKERDATEVTWHDDGT